MTTSSRKLTCRNGHTFPLPSALEDQEVVPCPACTVDVVVLRATATPSRIPPHDQNSSRDDTPRGRGLWQVMQHRQQPSDGPDNPPQQLAPAETTQHDAIAPSTKPRGLWALMGANSSPASLDESSSSTGVPHDLAESARPEFMKSRLVTGSTNLSSSHDPLVSAQVRSPLTGNSPTVRSAPSPLLTTTLASSLLDDDDEHDAQEVDDDLDSLPARPTGVLAGSDDHPQTRVAQERTQRRCHWALGLSVISVLLTPLNLLPWIVVKVPGVCCGLVGVFIGHQAFVDARRCMDGPRLKLHAMSAIGLGLLGMLAGPAGLIAVGQRWHQASLQRGATSHLQKLGLAIDAYEQDHDHYPQGGTVARDIDGEQVGMHGWMTFLLPHLGHEELSQKIELKQAFDHSSNKAAMTQVVSDFLVPNVEHAPTKTGLATTHFAGVGGQGTGPNGIVNYGIFNRNVTIRPSDVSDGLSQTLVVGEIAQQLPAWGDPENWREIETGLNRHSLGFGNKAGTGAHFLMGDGSVRFFPNHMSRDVLEKLSTRDGAEPGLVLEQ